MKINQLRVAIEANIRLAANGAIIAVVAIWILSATLGSVREWFLNQHLYEVLVLIVLAEVLVRLVEVGTSSVDAVTVHADEAESMTVIRAHVAQESPKSADFLEYSAVTVVELLEALKKKHCAMRILVCHPDAAISDLQASRIRSSLEIHQGITFADYEKVEIRLYRLPAAIRGRLLDESFVTVGWHVYDDQSPSRLHGHIHPMVSARTTTAEGQHLAKLFHTAFDHLWNAASTERLSLSTTQTMA
jgi:hypothetical protein